MIADWGETMDSWLVDRLDRLMILAQKRGASLVNAHCYVVALALLANLADASNLFLFIASGVFWGIYLYATTRWAITNAEYQINWRALNALNAKVLYFRSYQRAGRLIWLCSVVAMPPFMYLDRGFGGKLVIEFLSWAFPTLCWYLNTSSFIGYQPRTDAKLTPAMQGAEA